MPVGFVAVEQAGRIALARQQPVAGVGAVARDRLAGDHLTEVVEAGHVFERLAAVGGDAQLLAVLVLARGDVLQQLDRQAGVVAVVGRVPVPPAPGADRGHRGLAQVPFAHALDPGVVGVGLERGVDVGQAVVGVG